jgi:hypothetical protein
MSKRRYTFGLTYMNKLRFGIAVIKGDRSYFVADHYTRWLITDFDPKIGQASIKFKVWS